MLTKKNPKESKICADKISVLRKKMGTLLTLFTLLVHIFFVDLVYSAPPFPAVGCGELVIGRPPDCGDNEYSGETKNIFAQGFSPNATGLNATELGDQALAHQRAYDMYSNEFDMVNNTCKAQSGNLLVGLIQHEECHDKEANVYEDVQAAPSRCCMQPTSSLTPSASSIPSSNIPRIKR